MKIRYYDRMQKKEMTEQVYGEGAVNFLYDTPLGKSLWPIITSSLISKWYGELQSWTLSRFKVAPFVKKFGIKLEDFLPAEGGTKDMPYPSFNSFFIRKFKKGIRHFVSEDNRMGAFSEARYVGFESVNDEQSFPVKGSDLSAKRLLASKKWEEVFKAGPLMIARLCPVDYHRFHFPDDGEILDSWKVHGPLHSVNPLGLKIKSDIFCTNEREVTIIKTKNFGHIAYIEVGATCVGKIVQTNSDQFVKRGQEKGYFLFGGSTVIIIGEKGKWSPSSDIISYTKKGMETWVPLGDEVAVKL